MDDEHWPFTRKVIEEEQAAEATEDLRLGYSLLRALAEHDETLVEIAPGVWRHSKDESGRWS